MRTSYTQYVMMVEFMERHGDLSKPCGGPRDRHYVQMKWKELSDKLNSEDSGDTGPEEKWRKSRSSAGGAGGAGAAGAAGAASAAMEMGVSRGVFALHADRSPARTGLHVDFTDKGEVKERREKFLTAKYGSHQMALIRKRLAVEMWLYDELQKLYEPPAPSKEVSSAGRSEEVEVDIDELLDMEGDDTRRTHLAKLLADAKKPQKDVHKFINELLEKAKTL